MRTYRFLVFVTAFLLLSVSDVHAGVGDPQLRTDHPWYPGELACSNFERLFATQAKLYERVTGIKPTTDHHKALASWLWRNTHYWHGQEGCQDYWGKGFGKGGDSWTRDYWTGLFAHGFGLCGTTHSQWTAEMNALLGHCKSRAVGVTGHNSFEVFLTGGAYGKGRWAMLDHDLSTVIFNRQGTSLLSIADITKDWRTLIKQDHLPGRQHGWLVCGLHPSDGKSYQSYRVAEYLAGYSGVPPMVHLRRGEKLRRYFSPGLDDGKTFVYWGMNYNSGSIPGPERSRTWVNQPDKMYKAKRDAGHNTGQARYANAVYIYRPNFANGDYKEGVVSESDSHVDFEFHTPYIIAATPPNSKPWGIYDKGCKNGLVLQGKVDCRISVSINRGTSWQDCGMFQKGMDLTDLVKGHRQYWLRLHTSAKSLIGSGFEMKTVCQANASVLPRLKDNGTTVTFQASGQGIVSTGPNVMQTTKHIIAGKLNSPKLTLEMATPRNEPISAVHVAAHVFSSSPPNPNIKYQIEYSTDQGESWLPVVKDWNIERRGQEPKDFWSQSFCWGSAKLQETNANSVQVRLHNNGGKRYGRCEVHLTYQVKRRDNTKITFCWSDDTAKRRQTSNIAGVNDSRFTVSTGKNVTTHWVEMEEKKGSG